MTQEDNDFCNPFNVHVKVRRDKNPYYPIMQLKITHNGHMWTTSMLYKVREAEQVIKALQEAIAEVKEKGYDKI